MSRLLDCIPENPYLLLTPGPLSTSAGVRAALLRDWCTWDDDYNLDVVQAIRGKLVEMAAGARAEDYTAVLMQGSGTFGVEACLGTAIPRDGKVLVLSNGAYGERMSTICRVMGREQVHLSYEETQQPQAADVRAALERNPDITHVAVVHCETTTGILNPLAAIAKAVKEADRVLIVDAMSSFGGIPIDMHGLGIDFLVSSSNKCIQGVPGFSFVIARKALLERCGGNAHSHSLDLYDQWKTMQPGGKWRFTSPTHVVRAFQQALAELEEEGGVPGRHNRYRDNHRTLVAGMERAGFRPLLPAERQAPIITSFVYPDDRFAFGPFYDVLKERGFVLYPGKISKCDTFRVGNIGDIYPQDMQRLVDAVAAIGVHAERGCRGVLASATAARRDCV